MFCSLNGLVGGFYHEFVDENERDNADASSQTFCSDLGHALLACRQDHDPFADLPRPGLPQPAPFNLPCTSAGMADAAPAPSQMQQSGYEVYERCAERGSKDVNFASIFASLSFREGHFLGAKIDTDSLRPTYIGTERLLLPQMLFTDLPRQQAPTFHLFVDDEEIVADALPPLGGETAPSSLSPSRQALVQRYWTLCREDEAAFLSFSRFMTQSPCNHMAWMREKLMEQNWGDILYEGGKHQDFYQISLDKAGALSSLCITTVGDYILCMPRSLEGLALHSQGQDHFGTFKSVMTIDLKSGQAIVEHQILRQAKRIQEEKALAERAFARTLALQSSLKSGNGS